MKKIFFSNWMIASIIIFASCLRLILLSSIPNALNPDELAIGYNSYSILTTGADEWGNHFPILMKSFGDWKMVLYPLITMLPIKIFGLNEFSVRFPNAIFGILNVLLVYAISIQLFKKKSIGLFSSFLMAISPWAIFTSRGAFEFNLGVTLVLLGIFYFLSFVQNQKRFIYLYLSSIFFGLSLFSYHSFVVFTPIFFFAMLILYRKQILKNKINFYPIGLFFIFIVVSLIFLLPGTLEKANGDLVLSNKNIIYRRSDRFRTLLAKDNPLLNKLLFNRITASSYQIGQNYLLSFSPSFLFDTGGQKDFYNMEGFGPLYLMDFIFLFSGIFSLVWKKEKSIKFLALWILIAPIPSAIAATAPSQSRLVMLFPAFIIVEAFGIYSIGKLILAKKSIKYSVLGLIVILFYFLNFVYFVDMYYFQMNLWRARFFHYGYKQIVEIANKYPDYNIVVAGPENFPYISFLFYNSYDPQKFVKEVKYYPKNPNNGFNLVKSFGRYSFVEKIDRTKLKPKTLYFDVPDKNDEKNLIRYPTGDPVFVYFDDSFKYVFQNNSWQLL